MRCVTSGWAAALLPVGSAQHTEGSGDKLSPWPHTPACNAKLALCSYLTALTEGQGEASRAPTRAKPPLTVREARPKG